MSASAAHDAMVGAYEAQRARFAPDPDDAWAGLAQNFKADPRRPFDHFLTTVASHLRPDDTLLDVGGGAGRLSLPLASRCREVICIDPSPSMGEVFETTAKEAGITNARFVPGGWLEAGDIEGDVALVTHVTYFVPEVAPFVDKLNRAVGRRVLIGLRSIPPPNQIAPIFQLIRDEELASVPGQEELLAVLKEMGLPAELIDAGPAMAPASAPVGKTREDTIRIELDAGVRLGWLKEQEKERMATLMEQHFDELFAETDEGFRRRSAHGARELLITWET